MGVQLKIANQDNGERLDAVLARTYPQYSRVFFQKFLKKGGVTLAGAIQPPDYRVHVGQLFQVADFEAFTMAYEASTRPDAGDGLSPKVLHEDAALLVIDKPAGLVVHPAPGHRVGTLMDWLKTHLGPKINKVFTDPERLGLVHRLDKDTSGVLLIAKSILAQTAIARQFHDRTVQKTYTAFVEGVPSAKSGIINAPVGRSRKVPTRMEVTPLGRDSETSFELIEALKEVSQVSLHPKTGRTHQIRVHLNAIGHTIVGDRTYGTKSLWLEKFNVQRPLLHAEHLTLKHPTTGKSVTYHAPWPKDFFAAQKQFRKAFKAVLVMLAISAMGLASARAEETATRHTSHSTSSSSSGSSSKSSSLSSDVRRLKKDYASMEESLAEVKDSLEKLNIADRLRDLERAVSELNSRAVSGGTSTEETKTQLLDISRRVKSQSELLEQMRDQLDRLQRQVIKQDAATPTPASAPARNSAP